MTTYWIRSEEFTISHEKPEGTCYRPLTISTGMCIVVDRRVRGKELSSPREVQYPLPVLKSNLQKAIRRKKQEHALSTADYMISQYSVEFVRRLSVIMVEDTQIHTRYLSEIVWLMVAMSRGYILTEFDRTVLLESVQACLTSSYRYNLKVGSSRRHQPNDSVSLALYLRSIFGGMEGDIMFMERIRNRYQEGTISVCSHTVELPAIDEFVLRTHLLPESVDFHCYPNLLENVPRLTKEAVWWCLSSVNTREVIDEGATQKNDLDNYQRSMHRFEMKEHQARWNKEVQKMILSLVEEPREVVKEEKKQTTLDKWVKK